MMKINLLGGPKVVAPTEVPSAVAPSAIIVPAIVLVALGLVAVIMYFSLNSDIKDLNGKIQIQQTEKTRLQGVKAQAENFEKQINELQLRKDTVDQLAKSRVGPVELMRALGVTSTRSTDLYLSNVTTAGDHLTIKGQAGSADTIASFLGFLQGSGSFSDVQLQQSYQDNKGVRTNFDFTLACTFKSSASAGPETPAAQPGGGAPAGRRTGQ